MGVGEANTSSRGDEKPDGGLDWIRLVVEWGSRVPATEHCIVLKELLKG